MHVYCVVLYLGEVDLVGSKPILRTTASFSALTLLVGSFDPQKPIPDMTYNVFSGMLNPTQSINQPWQIHGKFDHLLQHGAHVDTANAAPWGPLCENMTSSTEPEVHNVLQCRQS